ncbi:MAG TPA: tat pathway signal sequence [Streptosporangiaceae bacterium]
MTRLRTTARISVRNGGCLAGAVLAAAAVAGCGLVGGSPANSAASPAARPAPVVSTPPAPIPSPSGPPCPARPAGFSCQMRLRIAAVEHYLRQRPGVIGVVLRDRDTGAVWRNRYAGSQIYMASTSKLAMAVTLLVQNQAGVIHLSPTDRAVMYQMLHVSSDNAADDLWFKYGASFYTSFFPRIGLASAQYLPQAGVSGPYWGEMTCTAEDESHVINYVLDTLPAPLRNYLVDQLRHVAQVQHFGVWGAGRANQPGNKDGWSVEKPGWIIDSVGFAGRGEEYTLAMMNSLNGQGEYADGTQTVTQVAALLFRGHHVPAPKVSATP